MTVLQALIAFGLLVSQSTAASQCYRMNGDVLDDESFAPCNPDADVSACCSTNKNNGDICMSSGLCYAQMGASAGFIYSNGCTDKTGKAKECPHICPDKDDKGNSVQWWNVLQCTRGSFCCTSDDSNCCGDEKKVFQADIGVIEQTTVTSTVTLSGSTLLPGATSSSGASDNNNNTCKDDKQCPKDNTAVVGGALGGILGTALLASLGMVAYLIKKRPSSNVPVPIPSDEKPAHELESSYRPIELQGNTSYN